MGDDNLLKEIGDRVSRRRRELNLTQEQLAEKMDVSLQMISNLEQGKKAIRPENLVKLCNALDVSADYILTGHISSYERSELSEKISELSENQQYIISILIDDMLNNKD